MPAGIVRIDCVEESCMKKAAVFLFLAMVLLGSCSIKQKIVGTWVDNENDTWVFNANGILSHSSWSESDTKNWAIEANRKLCITDVKYGYTVIYDITMTDSKNMSLEQFSTSGDSRVRSWWERRYSLIKK